MFKAEFICECGFCFEETFQQTEAIKLEDLERLYIRCPRCGEEARVHSFKPSGEKGRRQLDWS